MKYAMVLACAVLLTGVVQAQDKESWTGVSWGFTRTYWSANSNSEGYAQAGTAGPMLSLRRVSFVSDQWAVVPYLNYIWMSSRVTTSVPIDTNLVNETSTRSYFREIDLGANFNFFPDPKSKVWYLGFGPSVRWGQAGSQNVDGPRPGTTSKAAWFGLTLLGGFRTHYGDKAMIFFEPQLVISPDEADRYQSTYPPTNLNLQMGILFR